MLRLARKLRRAVRDPALRHRGRAAARAARARCARRGDRAATCRGRRAALLQDPRSPGARLSLARCFAGPRGARRRASRARAEVGQLPPGARADRAGGSPMTRTTPARRPLRVFVASAAELLTDQAQHGEGLIAWQTFSALAGRGHELVVCAREVDLECGAAVRRRRDRASPALGEPRAVGLRAARSSALRGARRRRPVRRRPLAVSAGAALFRTAARRELRRSGRASSSWPAPWRSSRPRRAGDLVRTRLLADLRGRPSPCALSRLAHPRLDTSRR